MKKLMFILIALFIGSLLFANPPSVTIVSVTPGTGHIKIIYNLTAGCNCQVNMLVSIDGGNKYTIFPTHFQGDIGNQVTPGSSKQIIWYPAQDGMQVGSNYKIKLIARDNPDPVNQPLGFVFVEGGTFTVTFEGSFTVTLSSFYIDKNEITQGEYEAVMGNNPGTSNGVGNDYPVYLINWFSAIEYCNWRSLQEHLTPCYSYIDSQKDWGTNPSNWPSGWNTTDTNDQNISCNWSANGYRLPTEMEWIFAARGGNQSHDYLYSGSDNCDEVAWYWGNANYSTHPIGEKKCNELGLYDMSGNVWEWVWDFFGYYISDQNYTDPRGPCTQDKIFHDVHGGTYSSDTGACKVLYRNYYKATNPYNISIGFRVCRQSI